jgi:hypothetical protein
MADALDDAREEQRSFVCGAPRQESKVIRSSTNLKGAPEAGAGDLSVGSGSPMRDVPPGLIPDAISDSYEVHNWRHAVQILAGSYPAEWEDVLEVLSGFVLRKSDVVVGGQGKSKISIAIDAAFTARGWEEREVVTKVSVDDVERESRTHKIDCLKNRVGLEIEWNSKDQTFVRDLNNFRVLFDMQVLDVGIIVTRADHLQQQIFDPLGVGAKYGASTTHMRKLLPRIHAGGGGGCPVLVFGITQFLYDPHS